MYEGVSLLVYSEVFKCKQVHFHDDYHVFQMPQSTDTNHLQYIT